MEEKNHEPEVDDEALSEDDLEDVAGGFEVQGSFGPGTVGATLGEAI